MIEVEPKKVTERQRIEISSKILAAMVSNANSRGVLPNPDMLAREAIKYTDALITELNK